MAPLTQQTLILEEIKSESGYAEIKIEEVKIVKNYDTILHIVNPIEIINILDNLENNIELSNLQDKAIPLNFQVKSIRNKIQTLIPHRKKRGLINLVGTVSKWLFGTMDNDDKLEIEQHLNIIDANNHNTINGINNQIKINQNFNETFTKLKQIIEKDRSIISQQVNNIQDYDKTLHNQIIYLDLALKLKILEDNVEHIQDNIASSRIGIVHSNILTNEEITEYKVDPEKLQNIKLGTVIDKNENIIFAIKIPRETINVLKTLLIPISDKHNRESMFNPQELVRYQNQTYEYIKNKDFKNLRPCNNCVIKKNCLKIFNNVSEVIELSDGIVLAKNQYQTNFTSNCDERTFLMEGNYLINFHNCSIKIGSYISDNNQREFKQSFVIPNYFQNIKNQNEKLIFDDIILKQIKNIDKIEEIGNQHKTHYIYGSIFIVIFVLIIIFAIKFTCKQKRLKIQINNKTQESPRLEEGGVTLSQQIPTENSKKTELKPEWRELINAFSLQI